MSNKYENRAVLTLKETAEILNLSQSTIRRYIKEGIITPYRVAPNGHYRFLKSKILSKFK